MKNNLDNQENISENLLEIALQFYFQKKQDVERQDVKITQMITLNIAILGFVLIYINNLFFIFPSILIISNLILLLFNFIPKEIEEPDLNTIIKEARGNKKDYIKNNTRLVITLNKSIESLYKISEKKSKSTVYSFYLLILESIFITIIKLFIFNC